MNLHAIDLPQLLGQRRVDGVESPRHRADAVRGKASRRWRGRPVISQVRPSSSRSSTTSAWRTRRSPRGARSSRSTYGAVACYAMTATRPPRRRGRRATPFVPDFTDRHETVPRARRGAWTASRPRDVERARPWARCRTKYSREYCLCLGRPHNNIITIEYVRRMKTGFFPADFAGATDFWLYFRTQFTLRDLRTTPTCQA